jgi:hypothetical protein
MPWKEVTPMEGITRFVSLVASGRFMVTELCADFGVSRKTAYKHLHPKAACGPSDGVRYIVAWRNVAPSASGELVTRLPRAHLSF